MGRRTPIRPAAGGAGLALALLCLAAFALLPASVRAQSAPEILSSDFLRPVKVDRPATLQVRARDPEAPVGGLLVAFGGGEGLFGLSACRADSSTTRLGGPFRAGSPVRFRVPHTFERRGPRPVLLKVDSGGCRGGGGTTFQTLTVTPTLLGEPSVPTLRSQPLSIVGLPGAPGTEPAPIDIPGLPDLPGVPEAPGGLPQLPGVPAIPGLPGVPELPLPEPELPQLPPPPELPPVPPLPLDEALPLKASASAGRRAIVAGGSAVVMDAAARAAAAACPNAIARPGRNNLAKARHSTLCLLNRERTMRGIRPLRSNLRLLRASFRHSRAMVLRGFFAHTQPGGLDFVTRLRRVRYITPRSSWIVGENIGLGTWSASSPLSLVRAWMASSGHRANILNPSFREIGLGIDRGVPRGSLRSGATYTTDFGRLR